MKSAANLHDLFDNGHKSNAGQQGGMAEHDFNDFRWFLVLARAKRFTRAAAKLGVAQSTLSHTIKRL